MPSAPEMSRRIQVNSLGRQDGARRPEVAQEITVEAAPAEHAALARRLDIPAVAALRCRFRLSPMDAAGRVIADGLLTATLTRVCVASLDEFETEVVEAFRIRFVPASELEADDDALDPDSDDDVPYEGIQIDLGEAAVEQVALAMAPYPRKPGVELPAGLGGLELPDTAWRGEPGESETGSGEQKRPNPFAVLAERKPR